MEYNTHDSYLTAAFAVVKQYDPALYQRMDADDKWFVSTDIRDIPPQLYSDRRTQEAMSGAFGTTWDNTSYPNSVELKKAITFIYTDMINAWSDSHGVHRAMFAAGVLAHEYHHAHQLIEGSAAEPPAFAAGSAFAAELPNPDGRKIKALSDETSRDYTR